MSITIFSVVPKRLIEDAKRIEKHAEDQLEAWIALGQSDKYAKAIDQARILRLAANGKDVYSRRAFLKIAGFTVKNLDKKPKENPVDDLPIWARTRPGRLGATQQLTASQKRTAKARAEAAGRKYPNLIDNIAAARNPTMKPASPAQLAARKRFAEMARSGAFKKATKRKANPLIISAEADKSLGYYGSRGHIRKLLEDYADSGRVVSVRKKRGSNAIGVAFSGGKEVTLEKAKIYLENLVNEGILKPSPVKPFRMNNPIDTYIEKFHLGGKIYAQIIEKSDNTFDYYVYQMQATGVPGEKPYEQFFDSKNYKTKSGAMRGLEKWAMRHQYKVTPQLHTNPAKKTVSQKISQLVHEGYPQRQAVAVALSEQRAGKVKQNPRPAKPKKYYQVSIMEEGTHTKFMPMALYFTFAEAENYANYLAKEHKNWTIRVHDTRAM
jgi:hypothetical protein